LTTEVFTTRVSKASVGKHGLSPPAHPGEGRDIAAVEFRASAAAWSPRPLKSRPSPGWAFVSTRRAMAKPPGEPGWGIRTATASGRGDPASEDWDRRKAAFA